MVGRKSLFVICVRVNPCAYCGRWIQKIGPIEIEMSGLLKPQPGGGLSNPTSLQPKTAHPTIYLLLACTLGSSGLVDRIRPCVSAATLHMRSRRRRRSRSHEKKQILPCTTLPSSRINRRHTFSARCVMPFLSSRVHPPSSDSPSPFPLRFEGESARGRCPSGFLCRAHSSRPKEAILKASGGAAPSDGQALSTACSNIVSPQLSREPRRPTRPWFCRVL
jgi:hypothetical protein